MSTPLEHRVTLPAGPDRVVALLTDERFLRDYAERLDAGVDDLEVWRDDGVVRTRLALRTATAGIPDLFRTLVGREVAVVDSRSWAPDGDGRWSADVEVDAEMFGRRAVVRGRQTIDPVPEGAESTTKAEATVRVPLVGRQAEAAVRDLVLAVLRQESALLRERLTAD
jgi:hypothetical protein